MEAIKGYVAITETLSGPELLWRIGEGDNTMPEIYDTENGVCQAIIEDVEEEIRQFHEGERDYSEINWPEGQYTVAEIEIDEQGAIIVWETGNKFNNKIIETTLDRWREGL